MPFDLLRFRVVFVFHAYLFKNYLASKTKRSRGPCKMKSATNFQFTRVARFHDLHD